MKNQQKNKKEKSYLGIIFIGMGSTYYTGNNIGRVAIDCAKCCRQDWSHLFKIKKDSVHPVNIYDATDTSGNWSCGSNGVVIDTETKKEIPFVKTVYATG